jgi:lysophospholipid acyltransferase (LPLAT)-like uncharacterized protein
VQEELLRAGADRTQGRRESHRLGALRRLVAPLVALALRALGATWRVESVGENPFDRTPRSPILAALWHEDMLVSVVVFRDRGGRITVSRSRDGEHISAVLLHLGFGEPVRGSSSRGGTSALRALVRAVQEGAPVAFLVDGPRGPARVSKLGVVAAARLSGEPIIPVAMVSRPCLRFRSWDRTQLPLPFARIVVGWGERIPVAAGASDAEQEEIRLVLDRELARVRDLARARLGPSAQKPPGGPSSH